MTADEAAGKRWEDFTTAELGEIAKLLNSGGPDRTAAIIRACLKPELLPHADAIIEAYEFSMALRGLNPDELLGTALVEAHRRGEDPAEVYRQWP